MAGNPTTAGDYGDQSTIYGGSSPALAVATTNLTVQAPQGWKLGGTAVSGNQAIVAIVTSNFCFSDSLGDWCINNTDPAAGLPVPNMPSIFADEWNSDQTLGSSDIECTDVNGQWLVSYVGYE